VTTNPLRDLPSVDALIRSDRALGMISVHGRRPVVAALRAALEACRARGGGCGADDLLDAAAVTLTRPPSLRPVLNATGVIVHTNLGRAPLAARALEPARGDRGTITSRRCLPTSPGRRRGWP
jgi:L-seryl-tRNA(Ser) seleniumtransferase